ncbi:hypothetical protein J4440_00505 [Candidatus Woesearchaeota archaeon]|nr:hypothetical protein [Candidatus Woesearchaeota archaeon]
MQIEAPKKTIWNVDDIFKAKVTLDKKPDFPYFFYWELVNSDKLNNYKGKIINDNKLIFNVSGTGEIFDIKINNRMILGYYDLSCVLVKGRKANTNILYIIKNKLDSQITVERKFLINEILKDKEPFRRLRL